MTFVRSLSKFLLEAFPLLIATVISAILVLALYLSSGSAQPQRETSDAVEPIVYISAMPRINRDPAPVVLAAIPPATAETVSPAETPATPVAAVQPATVDAVIPAKPTPRRQTAAAPTPREHATVTARVNAPAAAKVDPAVKVEPSIANVEPAPALAPPMPIPPMQIVSAEAQNATPEPTRIFGMTVPASVVNVGGKVVGAAKFPVEVAEVAVPSPLVRVGIRVVEKVAGAAGAAISDFGR